MSSCSLCGLPAGRHPVSKRFGGEDHAFCCPGCMNVYVILLESGVTDFRSSELFRESLRLGLISNREAVSKPTIPDGIETREGLFQISGMWCASCAWLIERALSSETGIVSAEVMFTSDVLKVKYCPQYVPPSIIPERIRALGYRAEEYSAQTPHDHSERRSLLLRLGIAFFLWMNVMTVSLVVYASYWESISDSAHRIVPFVLMGLATPAVFYSAWPILRIAWLGIRTLTIRMEGLLALGILAAYGYSSAQAFLGGQHLYFDTACAIVTLVLLGKALERGAKEKTAQSIAMLYRMMPKKARLLYEGRERFVSIEALEPGMTFVVKAGERVPADGVIVVGESHLDESVLTGESTQRHKRIGDDVICGSLNCGGVLEVCATRVGADSTLNQIIRSVQSAMTSRAEIERVVDRVSRAFVPAVLVFSVLTLLVCLGLGLDATAAILRAVAVLVIACPCALGIATPLAITTAVGACSRKGVLVSDSRVLETIGKVDVVLLDKTGTVTRGNFSVLQVLYTHASVSIGGGGRSEDPVQLAAALEAYSEHPLGRAIVQHAGSLAPLPPADDVCVCKGLGISGRIRGHRVFAGNRSFAEQCGAVVDDELDRRAAGLEARGHTVAFFGHDHTVAGAFVLGDSVRVEAASVVKSLRARGVRVGLISGDAEATTAWVASELAVDEHRSAVLPSAKMTAIREYQQSGSIVAMVGDGVNDAPALAAADLGIALGSGADLAMQSAPVVLVSSDLGRVDAVFEMSSKALRIVRQNLFWAFLYNVAGITLAATGVLNPILAATAMVFSSISVIANSMRLR